MTSSKLFLFELLTIIVSTVMTFLTIITLFSQLIFLKNKSLYGLNPSIENYINWSSIAIIILLLVAVIFVFPNKAILNLISVLSFGFLFITHLVLFIIALSKKNAAVNGYEYLFDEDDFMSYGIIVQKENNCCGWYNVSEPEEMMDQCFSNTTCRTVLLNYYSKRSGPVCFMLFLSMAANCFSIYTAFKILTIHKKPILSEYEERLTSQNMDDL